MCRCRDQPVLVLSSLLRLSASVQPAVQYAVPGCPESQLQAQPAVTSYRLHPDSPGRLQLLLVLPVQQTALCVMAAQDGGLLAVGAPQASTPLSAVRQKWSTLLMCSYGGQLCRSCAAWSLRLLGSSPTCRITCRALVCRCPADVVCCCCRHGWQCAQLQPHSGLAGLLGPY